MFEMNMDIRKMIRMAIKSMLDQKIYFDDLGRDSHMHRFRTVSAKALSFSDLYLRCDYGGVTDAFWQQLSNFRNIIFCTSNSVGDNLGQAYVLVLV